MEEIEGEPPEIRNLKDCTETTRLLHVHGIVHGDPNRYNFLITETGAMNFDFEYLIAYDDVGPAAAQEEIESIEGRLKDK